MEADTRMSIPAITAAITTTDRERAVAALALAFSSDPACRWAWPDPRQYLDAFPGFVRAFAGKAFDRGTAHRLGEYRGVALWLSPDDAPDEEALETLIRHTVAESLQDKLLAVFAEQAAYHPREPHWHLPLIGVDPAAQCQGYGSALLRHMLVALDREQLHAYLEATSPRNVPLYERHGFEALGSIQRFGSPPIVPMLRRPR
jgi:ribosomal protein S18 acetylase RimI-like enzyme